MHQLPIIALLVTAFRLSTGASVSVNSTSLVAPNEWADIVKDIADLAAKMVKAVKGETNSAVKQDNQETMTFINDTFRDLNIKTGNVQDDVKHSQGEIELLRQGQEFIKTKATDTYTTITDDVKPSLTNIRADINHYNQDVLKFRTEVIGLRQELSGDMRNLGTKIDNVEGTLGTKIDNVNQKLDKLIAALGPLIPTTTPRSNGLNW